MKYLWKCSPEAVILTAMSTVGIFLTLANLGSPIAGIFICTAPFTFGYCWFRLGQYALLRTLRHEAKDTP